MPARVIHDDPEALAQRTQLRAPVARAAAEAVRQHDAARSSGAVHLDMQRRRGHLARMPEPAIPRPSSSGRLLRDAARELALSEVS
jgi:hypothetical protein